MASGYEHAPVTQAISVLILVLSIFLGSLTNDAETGAAVNFYDLNFRKLSHGEIWRLPTSQLIFSHSAQVLVGLILLYTCREFERQMGSRKFSGFLLLTLCFSISSLLALVVLAETIGLRYTPSSGPFFLIYSLLSLFYFHVPKMPSSRHYSLLGVVFSEKSWTYLLAAQLLMSEGLASILPALVGMAAGYLYDVDWFGSQTYRIPQPVERFFSIIASFFAFSAGAIVPTNNNPGRLGNPRRRNPAQGPASINLGALLRENNNSNDGTTPLNNINSSSSSGGVRFRPQSQQAVVPPDEQSITLLMSMGFDRDAVVRALTATGNNVENAANLLVH